MVDAGETAKFAPLALVPILEPPVATVYHWIVLPAEVALRLEDAPAQIAAGVAVTEVGAEGTAFTVAVTAVLEAVVQPLLVAST